MANSYMDMIQVPNNSNKKLFQKVILNCLCRKSKAINCLTLRADNKVVPCHMNSMEPVNTEEMSCWMFYLFSFCTFPALPMDVCSIYLENQEKYIL